MAAQITALIGGMLGPLGEANKTGRVNSVLIGTDWGSHLPPSCDQYGDQPTRAEPGVATVALSSLSLLPATAPGFLLQEGLRLVPGPSQRHQSPARGPLLWASSGPQGGRGGLHNTTTQQHRERGEGRA